MVKCNTSATKNNNNNKTKTSATYPANMLASLTHSLKNCLVMGSVLFGNLVFSNNSSTILAL